MISISVLYRTTTDFEIPFFNDEFYLNAIFIIVVIFIVLIT